MSPEILKAGAASMIYAAHFLALRTFWPTAGQMKRSCQMSCLERCLEVSCSSSSQSSVKANRYSFASTDQFCVSCAFPHFRQGSQSFKRLKNDKDSDAVTVSRKDIDPSDSFHF